jgi:tRNA/rRNA methyltransferase
VTPPLIILVHPQLGQNIGMVARAMLNFGLSDLRLVAPRDGWPNPEAGPAAAGADEVLDAAQVYETLEAALADTARSFATTVRPRGMIKSVFTPQGALDAMCTIEGRCAWVFGPERSGLTTEDVALCDAILTIPTNPDFGSLNLAMAVTVMGYAFSTNVTTLPPQFLHGDELGPADHSDVQGLITHLETELEARNYFFPTARADTMRRNLAGIFRRPGFSKQEVRTLRGLVRSLTSNRAGH